MPRRGETIHHTVQTAGGLKLKELRQASGLSLVELAAQLEGEVGKAIDTSHISKIETGKIKQPDLATLEAILAGIHITYRERRRVLAMFGYQVPMTLPTPEEIDETVQLTTYELQDATHPILLVDLGQQLWAWNRYVPRMIGFSPNDPSTHQFRGLTLLDVTFNPAIRTSHLITNPAEFMPTIIYYIKATLFPFRNEPWCAMLLAKAETFPGFRAVWDSLPDRALERFVRQPIVPIGLQIADAGRLQFRMSTVEFEDDPRFHIIHFSPFGAHTLRVCATWAEEEGVL
jgi:transcriptional regulator with XRE-family HTH domain